MSDDRGWKKSHGRSKKGKVWLKTDGRCAYCGKVLHYNRNFTRDHLDPRAAGGSNGIENLVPACEECNRLKGDRPAEDFEDCVTSMQIAPDKRINVFYKLKAISVYHAHRWGVLTLSFEELERLYNLMKKG